MNFQPVLVVLILAVVLLNRYLNQKRQNFEKNRMDSIVSAQRRMDYNFGLMSDFRYGKEIRLFNISKNILNSFCTLAESIRTAKNEILKKSFITRFWISVFAFVQLIIVYFVTTKTVKDGLIDIGSYLTYIGLVSVFANAMNSLMDDIIGFKYHCMYVNDLMNFFDLLKEEKKTDTVSINDLKEKNWKLEFRDVSFRYPNTSVNAIDRINMVIHKGDKIAITGLNGAGKTTLIKLLTRLYEPTEGAIFLNDIDIRKIDRKEYYSMFAPMFQEVFMFAFSIAQNISLKPKTETDINRIKDKLNTVGLLKKIDELPRQLDTGCLTFLDPEGVQFSGGEQQRLLLARTLYADREICIFDEPSVNGTDIKNIPEDQYKSVVSTVFQDFQIFATSLKENIIMSKEFDPDNFWKALDEVDMKTYVESLPEKEETSATKFLDDEGVDFSGGQKQRLAIARALYQPSRFLILDEPTSALDPKTEYDIYKRIKNMKRDRGIIFISHRLSSCRYSDRILVIDNGRVVQSGNHDTLIRDTGNLYYELFMSQANYYMENDAEPGQ